MMRGYPRPRPFTGINESVGMPDNVQITVWECNPKTGQLLRKLRQQTVHNLVVNSGYDLLAALLNEEATGITHFAVGTDGTAVSLTQIDLGTEVFRAEITDKSHASGSGLVTFSHHLSSAQANGNTLREMGLFNASVNGDMFARALVTPVIVKDATKAVTFSWNIAFGSGSSLTITRQIGYVIYLDGNKDVFSVGNTYPSGATYNKIVPGSTVWYLFPNDLPVGTFSLEAMVRVDNASAIPTIGMVNLDDAPDTILTGSEVSGSTGNLNGERIRSGSIAFGAPASAKNYAVKVKTNNAAYGAAVWGIRIIQTS